MKKEGKRKKEIATGVYISYQLVAVWKTLSQCNRRRW